jgi:hypothetical protein
MRRACRRLVAVAVLGVIPTGIASAGPTAPSRASPNAYYEAAVRGDPTAQAKLAALYAKDSHPQAFQWSWRAAHQGHAEAQLQLSEMFASGNGTPKDLVTAYLWAHLAQTYAVGEPTTEKADRMIVRLAQELSDTEIKEALRRAIGWQPRPEAKPADRTEARSGDGEIALVTASTGPGIRRAGPRRDEQR